ncbi:unnamed protein product, partial [Rotaria magnacalcarata]
SNNQPSISSFNNVLNRPNNIQTLPPVIPTAINTPDTSSTKNLQRRRKGPAHRRNNSKGSVTSWTPPTLSAIADQEMKRASIHLIPSMIEKTI